MNLKYDIDGKTIIFTKSVEEKFTIEDLQTRIVECDRELTRINQVKINYQAQLIEAQSLSK